ncbi:MAG: hypothetical protein OXH06_04560 [Gemmatimonadetes bacterium]|nr:hypothetical protein [Gemmatimonadota bacterium]
MVCAVLCLGFYLTAPIAAGDAQLAEKLYDAAMEQVGSVASEESIKAFQRVLKADRNYAPAHYEIAKLYMSLDTLSTGRASAQWTGSTSACLACFSRQATLPQGGSDTDVLPGLGV